MVRMYSALTWSTVSIRLAVSWSEVWRLFLGAMGQGHGGLLGVAVIRPENLRDLVLHLPDRCLIGVLALDVGRRG